jgi:L-seryl-tRNA(Ser) seleniumtransferase
MADPHRARRQIDERLHRLPSVEQLASATDSEPKHLLIAAARRELAALRVRIRAGEDVTLDERTLQDAVRARAAGLRSGSLQPVINATGVILHTNLGRAPLAPEAAAAAARIASGYSNLEYVLEAGARGSRQVHVEPLLRDLSGAEAAMVVNNNAAAVLLALAAVAAGREVIVSRGQLVEIGNSFRIPEILAQSGATLVEVGTTNRTRRSDYETAIGECTAAIMRVHQSNFRTVGFVATVALRDLAALAAERDLLLVDDVGSGAIAPIGDEPAIRESVEAGADLVCASADKLVGGPQAGILVGRTDAIERCRRHPLARALRLDKLQLAALEATLRLHRDHGPASVPALGMLATTEDELRARAELMVERIGAAATVGRATSAPGGGSLPLTELEGPVCVVETGERGAEEVLESLRAATPPLIARVSAGSVILDPRTMDDREAELAAEAVRGALG